MTWGRLLCGAPEAAEEARVGRAFRHTFLGVFGGVERSYAMCDRYDQEYFGMRMFHGIHQQRW